MTQKPTCKRVCFSPTVAVLITVGHKRYSDTPEEGYAANMGIAKMQADVSRLSAFVFQFSCISSRTLLI